MFEFDAGFRDPALHRVILDHGAAKGGAFGRPYHHQLDQKFAQPDRTHAMMNARGTEADLRDLEALSFFTEQVLRGDADIFKGEFADRRDMVLATHPAQPPDETDARGSHRHDDAGVTAGAVGIRIGHPHHNHEAALREGRTGDETFATVVDVIDDVADHSIRESVTVRRCAVAI